MEWITRLFGKRPPASSPTPSDWTIGVFIDEDTNLITGLPPHIERMIRHAGLTDEDIRQNPDVLMNCLRFRTGISSSRLIPRGKKAPPESLPRSQSHDGGSMTKPVEISSRKTRSSSDVSGVSSMNHSAPRSDRPLSEVINTTKLHPVLDSIVESGDTSRKSEVNPDGKDVLSSQGISVVSSATEDAAPQPTEPSANKHEYPVPVIEEEPSTLEEKPDETVQDSAVPAQPAPVDVTSADVEGGEHVKAKSIEQQGAEKPTSSKVSVLSGKEEDGASNSGTQSSSQKKPESGPIKKSGKLYADPKDVFIFESPKKSYSSWKKIGEGGFGDVYIAEEAKTKNRVAVKVSHKKKDEPLDVRSLTNEILMLQTCRHENIVNYLKSYMYKDQVWVVMEYLDGGALTELLTHFQLGEPHIAAVCKQVLKGLNYLHSQHRIHRDIKSDNILLGSNGEVKVADLGLCAQLDETGSGSSKTSMAGSPYWMAPEMIQNRPYDTKADIWSLGSVAIEMAEGKPPYSNYKALKAMFKVATVGAPKFKDPSKWSRDFFSFIEGAMQSDPSKRSSASRLLEHPFLNQSCPPQDLAEAIKYVFFDKIVSLSL